VLRRLLARCESVKDNIRNAVLKSTGATDPLPIIDEVPTANSRSTTAFIRSIQEMRERTSESASSIFESNELPMITFQRFIYSRQISSERTTKFLRILNTALISGQFGLTTTTPETDLPGQSIGDVTTTLRCSTAALTVTS